jgi:uncharacterized protein
MITPSEKEQEYFLRKEFERIKVLREEHLRKVAEAERQKLKELHFMHCAKCGQTMTTTELHGILVEICPGCNGVYLDAGELDKIIQEQNQGIFRSAIATLRSFAKG